jgi:hypothetical protein
MATTVDASLKFSPYFYIKESSGNYVNVYNDKDEVTAAFTYGSGISQINAAIKATGVIPSGSTVQLDLTNLSRTQFGVSYTVPFSGIKAIQFNNLATASGQDINIRATGVNAFTNLFNGGSGNLLIKPYAAFAYADPFGSLRTSSSQRLVSLRNVSSSGVPYSVTVMGTLQ